MVVELAINRIIKVILRAGDSSGMIGDLAQQLLEAHAQICDAGVADPKALAKWMVRFGFDEQDFFTVDPVRHSTALGDNGLAALRRSVDDRSAHPDPDFAVRYTQERLAVIDGDIAAECSSSEVTRLPCSNSDECNTWNAKRDDLRAAEAGGSISR